MSTLGEYMFLQFSALQYAEFFIRLVIACICGASIGVERTKRLKEAGVRTHVIVCLAAALTMIVSKYGFADLTSAEGIAFAGTRGADPARVAAQIVSGVSFLGAGIIFRNGSTVRGLTTAAGIWATAGIGLAIGSGMYVVGVFATIVVIVIQIIMHRFTIGTDSMSPAQVVCRVRDLEAFRAAMASYETKRRVQVVTTKVSFEENDETTVNLSLRVPTDLTIHELAAYLQSLDGVRAISCELGK